MEEALSSAVSSSGVRVRVEGEVMVTVVAYESKPPHRVRV